MAEMTSQEALNGIFTLLSSIVQQQNTQQQSRKDSETEQNITSLLKGMVETNSASQIASAGEALEKLSKGVASFDKETVKSLKDVSTSIATLNGTLNLINSNIDVTKGVDKLISVFERFADIGVEHAKNLVNFVESLALSNPKETFTSVKAIKSVIDIVNTIMAIDMNILVKQLKKLNKNKSLAKAITKFIITLNNELKDLEPISKETAEGISKLLSGIANIVDLNLNKMMWKFNPLYAKLMGQAIGRFISNIAKELVGLNIPNGVENIGKLLEPISKIGSDKHFSMGKILRMFNPINARYIGFFFKQLLAGIPKEKEELKGLEAVTEFFNQMSKLGVTATVGVIYLGKHLKPEYGTNIAEFIKNLATVGDVKEEAMENTVKFIDSFSSITKSMVLCFGVLTILITILPITSLILATALLYYGIKFMKNTIIDLSENLKKSQVKNAENVISSMSVMMLTMTASLAILVLVSKFASYEDIGKAVIMFSVMLLGVWGMVSFLTNKQFKSSLKNAVSTIYAISVLLLTISVSMTILTYTVKNNDIADIGLGFLIIGVFTGIAYLIVTKLANIKSNKLKDVNMTLLTIAGVYLIISVIAATMLIPIGQKFGAVMMGSAVVLGTILGMTYLVKLLGNIKKPLLANGLLAIGVITLTLLATTLIINELIIPIGEKIKEAAVGCMAVLGVILLSTLILKKLSTIRPKTMLNSILAMGVISLTLLITSIAIKEFLIPAGEHFGDAMLGLAAVGAVIAGMSGVIVVLTKLKPEQYIDGAIALAAISGLTLLLGVCINPIIDIAIKAGTDPGKTFAGLGAIATILVGITGIIVGLGALLSNPVTPIVMAIGAASLAVISALILAVAKVTESVINTIELVSKYSDDQITQGRIKIVNVLDSVYDIASASSPGLKQAAQLAIATSTLPLMLPILGSVYVIAKTMRNISRSVNTKDIVAFKNIVIGETKKPKEDPNSLLGSMYAIVDAFASMNLNATIYADLISATLLPIIDTVSLFIDVIKKVATMQYIIGYDKNGKPMYDRLPANVFKDAATVVTDGFGDFLTMINDKFKSFSLVSLIVVKLIGKSLNPIVDTVSKFVDIIIKVSKMQIVTGYDNKGKPIYEQLPATTFSAAATAVSNGFGEFLSVLNDNFDKLKDIGEYTIKQMGKALKPVVETVAKFVDTVIKVATLQIVTGYDDKDHPIYEKVESKIFSDAAKAVSSAFREFLTELNTNMNMPDKTVNAMNAIRKSIAPVMQGISSFVDAIVKLASAQIPDEWDKDGKPVHYVEVSDTRYTTAANTIAKQFGVFMDEVTKNFSDGFFTSKTKNALNALKDTIGPVMDGIGKWTDSILALASGTITYSKFDEKTNSYINVTEKISNQDYIDAAAALTASFTTFITAITNAMTDDLRKKAEKAKDAINESINPIMDAVLKFSQALKPFLELKDNKEGTVAKANNYLCFQPNFIKTISKNVADAFVTFIGTIADTLADEKNKEKYQRLNEIAPTINKTLTQISNSSKSLKSIIEYLTKDDKVITTGPKVAEQFHATLEAFVSGLTHKDDPSYYLDIMDTYKTYINPLLTSVQQSARTINTIIGYWNTDGTYTKVINEYNSIINKIVNTASGISKQLANVNTYEINALGDTYQTLATKFTLISTQMQQNAELSTGIDIFVSNLNKLTGEKVNKQMVTTGGNIQIYVKNLTSFTTQIDDTTAHIKIYVTELESARKALEALDEQIIKNENKRNNALQTFADKINNIADAVKNMKEQFDNLNENKILSQFDNIRTLINSINTEPDNKPATAGQQAKSTNNTQVTNSQPARTNSLFGNNIQVEFIFPNMMMTGQMNVKPK